MGRGHVTVLMREDLKNALFQDAVMFSLCDSAGVDEVEREIRDFRSDLNLQLKELEDGGSWRRGVTALVIRCKSRLREIERGEWDLG